MCVCALSRAAAFSRLELHKETDKNDETLTFLKRATQTPSKPRSTNHARQVSDPYTQQQQGQQSGYVPDGNGNSNAGQARFLRDALAQTRRAAHFVRRAADQGNLREALRYSAAMLGELRTGYLGPQQYYELYVAVGDELDALAQFLRDETDAAAALQQQQQRLAAAAAPDSAGDANGSTAPLSAAPPPGRPAPRSCAELYEAVQHAGNVLPRLYLMVLAGTLLARAPAASSGGVRARDVLADLAEMAKGEQHPLRGLFLRAFLCQQARAVLQPPPPAPQPSCGDDGLGAGGGAEAGAAAAALSPAPAPPPSVEDAVDFLLSNFVESNKLWVRMGAQAQAAAAQAAAQAGRGGGGGASDAGGASLAAAAERERREHERAQLRDLVGKNVTQLAQLDGLAYPLYARAVLPRLLEQCVGCRDSLAQGYLMQVVIQCFPDAWHVGTLDALLSALPELQPGVRLAAVVASLADRLARFAASAPAAGEGEGDGAAAAAGRGPSAAAAAAGLRSSGALERLSAAVARASAAHGGGLSAASVVEMHAALASFARAVHPSPPPPPPSSRPGDAAEGQQQRQQPGAAGAFAQVDQVLRDCRAALLARAGAAAQAQGGAEAGLAPGQQDLSSGGGGGAAAAAAAVAADPAAERALSALLSEPVDGPDLAAALEGLPSLPPLAALLPARARRALATRVAGAALAQLAAEGGGDAPGAADAAAARLRSPELAGRLLVFVSPLLGDSGASAAAAPVDDDEVEEDVLLAARLIHALQQQRLPSPSAAERHCHARACLAALRAARPHVEGAPSRRARLILLPTLAFCALRLVRPLLLPLPGGGEGDDAAQRDGEQRASRAAAHEAVQWVLELALALAGDALSPLDASAALVAAVLGAPAPPAASAAASAADAAAAEAAAVTALRLLLAAAAAASEDLRAEALAYECLEQALTLYEEAGIGASARHRGAALQSIVGALHGCRALGRESRETLSQSAVGYAGKLLHRADQCRAVCAAAHLAWQEEEGEEGEEQGEGAAAAGAGTAAAAEDDDAQAQQQPQQQQRYPPCRDAAKVMAALKRALKVAQAAKQQRVLGAPSGGGGAGGGGGFGGGGEGGFGGGIGGAPSAAQAAHAAHAALASATYLGLAVTIANKYLYFYARGVDGLTPGAVQQLLELVAAEVAAGGEGAAAAAAATAAAAAGGGGGGGGGAGAAALAAAAAAAGGPTAAVAVAAAKADAEARRFWAATLAHVAYQQRLEQQQQQQQLQQQQHQQGRGGGADRGAGEARSPAAAPFSALKLPPPSASASVQSPLA